MADKPQKLDALDKRIDAVCKKSIGLAGDIHDIAVECLKNAQKHNDPRKLDRLVTGLHRASRPEALKVWVQTYSPVRWNGDGKVGMLKITAKAYTPFNVPAAEATPYYEAQEKVGKPLTLAAMLAIIARMDKKVEKAEEAGTIDENENVVDLMAFAKRIQAAAQEIAGEIAKAPNGQGEKPDPKAKAA